jgi:N-acetylglutamate synthase-like GNAT family acetyltransferase
MDRAWHVDLADAADAPGLCEPILRSVPDWFGIEEATRRYIENTAAMPTWIARRWTVTSGPIAGFATIQRHFPESAEIHCIAVHKDWHGRGVGTTLVRQIEHELRDLGVKVLQVKTMGPSKPNADYALTLRFYLSVGFVPLEEMHGLWPGIPALVMVKHLEPSR